MKKPGAGHCPCLMMMSDMSSTLTSSKFCSAENRRDQWSMTQTDKDRPQTCFKPCRFVCNFILKVKLTFSLARCSRATKASGTDRFWAMVLGRLEGRRREGQEGARRAVWLTGAALVADRTCAPASWWLHWRLCPHRPPPAPRAAPPAGKQQSDTWTSASSPSLLLLLLHSPLGACQGSLSEGSTCRSSASSCPSSWPSWSNWSRSCWPFENREHSENLVTQWSFFCSSTIHLHFIAPERTMSIHTYIVNYYIIVSVCGCANIHIRIFSLQSKNMQLITPYEYYIISKYTIIIITIYYNSILSYVCNQWYSV